MHEKTDKKALNIWKNHSQRYLEMALGTDKRERVTNPDGYGKRTGECRDTVEMFLTIRNNRIQSISFDTDGCINTNACANTLVFLAEGKTIAQAWGITPEKVIDFLETLPEEHAHCAELAVGALYLALVNFQECKHAPWKRLYVKR
jgi:nitrogen fixation NifU-like protein